MLLIRQKMVYREDIKNNPDVLYVFGDNLEREGLGGQAAEMRGEPNSFGIATKRSPGHSYPSDYFLDAQEDVGDIIFKEFERLENLLLDEGYRAVVVPSDGLGTGLSRMPELAPKALKFLNTRIEDLKLL